MDHPNFSARLASNRQDFFNRTEYIADTAKDKSSIKIKPLEEILSQNKKLMEEKARGDFEAEQQKLQDLERQKREFKSLWDSTAEDRRKQLERLDAEREATINRITAPGYKFKESELVKRLKQNLKK
jgi:hypothetical protein